MLYFGTDWRPVLKIIFEKPSGKKPLTALEVNAEEFISVKGFKALGNQLTDKKIKKVELKEALEYEEQISNNPMDIEVINDETLDGSELDSQIAIDF